MSISKRLYRSRDDRIFAGIFGGLGEYFNIDPVLLRLVWIVLFILTGGVPGLVIYVLAIFVVPLEPEADGPVVHHMGPETKSQTEAEMTKEIVKTKSPDEKQSASAESQKTNLW